ncbi:MAG TPA: hypothetical protein VLL82_16440 [Mycobacterium sp.]|nr:hypothetical protein [Mycobacterium sp.]
MFDDSVLGVAAVSAPAVTSKLADTLLHPFDHLSVGDKDWLFKTFRCHPNTVSYRLRSIEERSGRAGTGEGQMFSVITTTATAAAFTTTSAAAIPPRPSAFRVEARLNPR